MSNSNPAFSRSLAFREGPGGTPDAATLDAMYDKPSATGSDTGRMTYEDTVMKTLIAFGVLRAGALVGGVFPALAIPGLIIGVVLALVNIFKKEPSRGLILAYAGFEGLFVGGISAIAHKQQPGDDRLFKRAPTFR